MKTMAIDINCPNCCVLAGTYCNGLGVGVDLCQARINAASAATREANRKRMLDGGPK